MTWMISQLSSTLASVSLCLAICATLCLQANATVYRDFWEFESEKTLEYGMSYIGSNLDMLNVTDNVNHFPRMRSFFLYLEPEDSNKTETFCKNYKNYLKDKKVLAVAVPNESAKFLLQCLKNSGLDTNEDLTGLVAFLNPNDMAAADSIKSLQSMGAKFGLKFNPKEQDRNRKLIEFQEVGVTVDYVLLTVEFNNRDKLFYDFNSFAEFLDREYSQLTQFLSGFNPNVIVATTCDFCMDNMEEYTYHLERFAYWWGEIEKQLVLPVCFIYCRHTSGRTSDILARAEKVFSNPIRPSLSLYAVYPESWTESMLYADNVLVCKYFKSVFIAAHVYERMNYTNLRRLASVHSNLPCKVTWNVMFLIGGIFPGETINTTTNSNYEFISNMTRLHPGLIQKVYLELNTFTKREDKIYGFSFDQSKLEFEELKKALNTSPTVLLFDPMTEADKMLSEKRLNLSELLNTSVGTSITIKDSSFNFDAFKKYMAENYNFSETEILITYSQAGDHKGKQGDCVGLKQRWSALKSWADINSIPIVLQPFSLLGTPLVPWKFVMNETRRFMYAEPWFKNHSVFGKNFAPENATTGEICFLSKFQDTCVVPPQKVPGSPISFGTNLSGVTLNLTSTKYSTIEPDKIGDLMRLIHLKFQGIEIVPNHHFAIATIHKAIQRVKEHTDPTEFRQYRYYIRADNVDLSELDTKDIFEGIHTQLCYCENDSIFLEVLRKTSPIRAGFSTQYEEAVNPENLERLGTLLLVSDYIVVQVDLAKALLRGQVFMGTEMDEFSDKLFYSYIENGQRNKFPNPVFDNLRAIRFNIIRVNPNATVYMQIAWPTINYGKSQEQTLKIWAYLNDFSREFNFPFFINEAFDHDIEKKSSPTDLRYGVWKLTNDSDIGNPDNYIDKEAEFYQLETRRPKRIGEPPVNFFSPMSMAEILAGSFALLLMICLASVVVYRQRNTLHIVMVTKEEIEQFENGEHGTGTTEEFNTVRYDKDKYEIRKDTLNLLEEIGRGEFGVVHRATRTTDGKLVAVKVSKTGRFELLSALREIKVMSYLGEHRNILTLVGACTSDIQNGKVYVITEFLINGSLKNHLPQLMNAENPGEDVLPQLHQFCFEIANGMKFLREKRVIHGDLSTRNVLLGENNVCKISDFGLSRRLYNSQVYQPSSQDQVAWKWMAVEVFEHSSYSLKSDIWSLGVTYWEIYSFAQDPYPGESHVGFSGRLKEGLRLTKPDLADQEIYDSMLSCWNIDPDLRPTAETLTDFFAQFLRYLPT